MHRGRAIREVRTTIVELPLIRPHKLAGATFEVQPLCICEVEDEEGRIGLGEGASPGGATWSGEDVYGIKAVIDRHLAPLLLANPHLSARGAVHAFAQKVRRNYFAKATLEAALLDLRARQLGVPTCELLGGAVRRSVEVLWVLASGNVEEEVEEAVSLIETGQHRIFKIKMGFGSPAQDTKRAAEILRRIGDSAEFRIDLNQSWSFSDALRYLPILADAGLRLVEQPLREDDLAGTASLSNRLPIPIMMDESVQTCRDAAAFARFNASTILSLKPMKSGGIIPALEIAGLADAFGWECFMGSSIEGSIGTANALQVAACAPQLSWGSELFGPLLMADDVVSVPCTYAGSKIELGEAVGNGMEIDRDKLSDHAVK